jgi:hypothetical protein
MTVKIQSGIGSKASWLFGYGPKPSLRRYLLGSSGVEAVSTMVRLSFQLNTGKDHRGPAQKVRLDKSKALPTPAAHRRFATDV